MKPRTASRLAWSLWTVAMAFLASTVALVLLNRRPEEDPIFAALLFITVLGFSTVGALIASRQASNPIGWLFLVFACTFALAGAADQYLQRGVVVSPGSLPLLDLAAWITNVAIVPAFGTLPLVFLFYPSGRVPSPRWRPVFWAMVVFPLVAIVGLSIRPGQAGESVTVPNPTGVPALRPLASVLLTVAAVGSVLTALACVAALFVRFRRARGEERQQIRWLAYVAVAAATLLLATFSTSFLPVTARNAIGDGLFISFVVTLVVGIPTASGVAILKYRLYDLDVVLKKVLVFGILTGFVAATYGIVVIGIPALVFGIGSDARNAIPFVAAALLALAFQPMRQWAGRLANRLVYGRRATPYEVLAEFSNRLAAEFSADDVLPRMARILGEGTGAARTEVWLRIGEKLRREASWPDADADAASVNISTGDLTLTSRSDRAFPVRDHGELLGALAVTDPRGETFTSAQERLIKDLASQAALVLRNVRLIEELRASRKRLVSAQDEERRRIERNIHDGAQQQLVALAVRLNLAQGVAAKKAPELADLLGTIKRETQQALEDLRDLARGIYPPLLADKGLPAALEAQARKSSLPVEVHPDGVARYPAETEAAVYFCVLEALQNAAKYADASRVDVRLEASDGELRFEVADDGKGFDATRTPGGTGLQNMVDRLDALGGSLEIRSAPGRGTTVAGRVPVAADEGAR